MKTFPRPTAATYLTGACVATLLLTTVVMPASGQTTDDGFLRKVQTLPLDSAATRQAVAVAGDLGVIGQSGAAAVLERNPETLEWAVTGTLTAGDGAPGFGRSVATDGRTIVVGAGERFGAGAAYIFERRRRDDTWQEVTRLTGDVNSEGFGSSVAVSGSTVVVGAPAPSGPGIAYVFERTRRGRRTWSESDRLVGNEPFALEGMLDSFGSSVAVDEGIIAVAARSPSVPLSAFKPGRIYLYARTKASHSAFFLESKLTLPPVFDGLAPLVSLSGRTLVASIFSPTPDRTVFAIFEENAEAPHSWIQTASKAINAWHIGVSDDRVVASTPTAVHVFSRHQGATGAWGEVAQVAYVRPASSGVAVSGDTMLVTIDQAPMVDLYVMDTDRDGLTDSADRCPRDPSNDVGRRCVRDAAAHADLNDLVSQTYVASTVRGRLQSVTAVLLNTSTSAIANPFFAVTDLAGANVLLNGDGGRAGLSATLSPDVGDGVLSPGESATVTFRIRLRTRQPSQFFVTLYGDQKP